MTNLERIRAMSFDDLCCFLFGDIKPCPICPCYLCDVECDDECIDHFEAFVFDNIPKKYKDKEWRLAATIFLAESTVREFSVFLSNFFNCRCCSKFEKSDWDDFSRFIFCNGRKGCIMHIAKWLSAEFDESDWIQRFPDFM